MPTLTIRRELDTQEPINSMHRFLLEPSFLLIKQSYTKLHLPFAMKWRSGAQSNGVF
ncbi:hypothetical protein PHJA_000052300 [Phtheirospermum japonicum]|uniref:Uncharacterized protein n=1 Tax=Phtheirospermum japonicum TaxID=374723 RepID=A0A830B2E5_9LAMI|nr:hypothetical protein PHJA_000052300 [Phtheirospermum japonicum]